MQQPATVAHADFVLLLLVDAVKWGKVDVGGCLIDIYVVVIGSENTEHKMWLVRTEA